jgi:hypothetical protein
MPLTANAKKRRSTVLAPLVATAMMLAAAAPTALACMCLEPPSPTQALEQADAVFSGRCVEVEPVQLETPYGKLPKVRAVLEVKAVWKGLGVGAGEETGDAMEPRTIEVWTGSGGGDCGFAFEKGKTYLIYARVSSDAELTTDICTRSGEAELVARDVAALGDPMWTAD